MKKTTLLSNSLSALAICFVCNYGLTSCNDAHDLYQGGTHTTDLVIPDGFEWNNFENVTLSIAAPIASLVKVYTDESCSEENLIAGLYITADETNRVELNVPATCQRLYIKYPTANGDKIVNVNMVADSRAATGTITLPDLSEYGGGGDDKGLSYIIYKGTVVFEDNWPNTGDYDFNDAVIDYAVTSYVSMGSHDQSIYKNERIEVKFTVRAVGGNYPSAIGFTITNKSQQIYNGIEFQQKYIERYTNLGQTTNGLTVRLANEGKTEEVPVIWVEGLQNLKKGGSFFNTEQTDGEAVTAEFAMYGNQNNNLNRSLVFTMAAYPQNQDIFIRNSNGREIHLKGYAPTSQYTKYDNDATTATDGTIMSDNYYCNSDGFIWAMKLPSGFRYPKEKIDIRDAYPDTFAKWVTSGGTAEKAWYSYPNNNVW